VFHKPVKLKKTIFHGTVTFNNIKFNDSVSFAFATFQGDALFEKTIFEHDVFFLKAKFSNKVSFIEAKFQKETVFDYCLFSGNVHFRKANFYKASFIGVIFKKKADFEEIEFTDLTVFSRAKFFKTAWFNNALFQAMAKFAGSEFHESVSFMDCQFNSLAIFMSCVFYKGVIFKTSESSSGYLIFLASYFQSPKNVQIIGYSFSRVSFVLTDIEGVIWIPMCKEDKYILDDKLLRLLEGEYHRDLVTDNPDITSKLVSILNPYINRESVIQEYKRIRKCLESNKMFTEAVDLFIREMELARKFLSWRRNFFEKIAHFLYDIFSKYGESINRPILFVLGVNFLAPILLLLLFPPLDSFDTAISRLSEYPKYFQAVLAVFMQIKSFADPELGLKNIPLIIEILIRIFAIIIFGNLFVAVRRRLERR
jgi:uncharacterized protein YjbI with pentapeptide repeats